MLESHVPRRQINVYLRDDDVDRLDAYAKAVDASRSTAARQLIREALAGATITASVRQRAAS